MHILTRKIQISKICLCYTIDTDDFHQQLEVTCHRDRQLSTYQRQNDTAVFMHATKSAMTLSRCLQCSKSSCACAVTPAAGVKRRCIMVDRSRWSRPNGIFNGGCALCASAPILNEWAAALLSSYSSCLHEFRIQNPSLLKHFVLHDVYYRIMKTIIYFPLHVTVLSRLRTATRFTCPISCTKKISFLY